VPAVLGLVIVSKMTPAFAVQSASAYSRSTYFISSLPAILHYVALFLWPTGQSADAAYPVAGSFFDAPVVLAAFVLACGIGFIVRAFQTRRHEAVALSLAWFLLCIFPSQSIFPLAEVVNEHRPYLGVAGLCPLLAAGLLYGPQRLFALTGRRALTTTRVLTAVALSVFALLTIARNQVWQNEISLWQDVAAKAPTSTRAQMNYGRALMAAGRLQEAEQPLRDAVRFGPNYSYAYINLGVWLGARGKFDEARAMLDRALAIDPNLIHSQFQRGMLAERLNEPVATRIQYFKRATEISPNHVDAQYHLALALMAARKPDEAAGPARKAVELRGSFEDRFMLAYVLLSRGEAKEAEPLLLALQRERSTDDKVAYNLTYARKLLGRNAQ
jgi:Flp pilus assembly protein TadD